MMPGLRSQIRNAAHALDEHAVRHAKGFLHGDAGIADILQALIAHHDDGIRRVPEVGKAGKGEVSLLAPFPGEGA